MIGLLELTEVRVEPCRYYSTREHRMALPGVAEPIQYEMPICQKTASGLGPDGLIVVDPKGSDAPDGGQPCASCRGCFQSDVLMLL